MRFLLLASFFLCSCAETKIQLADAKHPASFRTASDVRGLKLVLTKSSATFTADEVNNSRPTLARGKNIATTGDAVMKALVAAKVPMP